MATLHASGRTKALALATAVFAASLAPSCDEAGPYVLRFADDFDRGLSARDDLGISIVFAVDVSGSMEDPPAAGGEPKYVQAAAAIAQACDAIEEAIRKAPTGLVIKAGVLRFNEGVSVLLPLVRMDAEGLAALRAIGNDPGGLLPRGSTAIGSALERGTEALALSGTILRSLIVVTDGQSNTGPAPEAVLDAIYSDRNSASTAESPVYTNSTLASFIGFDVADGLFSGLEARGARVMSASDGDQLAATILGIIDADITKLEAGSPAKDGSR